MLRILRKENIKKAEKNYSFKYNIRLKNNIEITGEIKNSDIEPFDIFLKNRMTYFSDGKIVYYNKDEIVTIEITDLVEKV